MMTMNKTQVVVLIAGIGLSLLNGRNAHADRIEVSVGGGEHFVPMDSMDALTSDASYTQFRFGLGVLLPELVIVPDTSTEIVLEYQSGSIDGQSFQAIDSELDLSTVYLSGRIRKHVYSRFSAFVQAGVGWQRSTLLLNATGTYGRSLEGDSNGLSGLASLGVDFAILNHPNSPVAISFRTELGYQASTSLSIDASPSDGDSLSISTQSSELGSVNTSGANLKWGIAGIF